MFVCFTFSELENVQKFHQLFKPKISSFQSDEFLFLRNWILLKTIADIYKDLTLYRLGLEILEPLFKHYNEDFQIMAKTPQNDVFLSLCCSKAYEYEEEGFVNLWYFNEFASCELFLLKHRILFAEFFRCKKPVRISILLQRPFLHRRSITI